MGFPVRFLGTTAIAMVLLAETGFGGACTSRNDTSPSARNERVGVTASALGTFNMLARCSYNGDTTQDCTNLAEAVLTPTQVAGGAGQTIRMNVNDRIFAQPLYASSVTIGGTAHDVLYVATMDDYISAFDAESGATLWHLGYNAHSQLKSSDVLGGPPGCNDVSINNSGTAGDIGIEGTPVIDGSTGTIYFVTAEKTSTTTMVYRLHAVDITNGNERSSSPYNSPQPITIPADAGGGFNEEYEQQRAALVLANGYVYVGFGGFCDTSPAGGAYHGYLFAYSASNLATAPYVFNTTPGATSGAGGGLWQSGEGPAIDSSGKLYVAVGNGLYDGTTLNDFGNSVVKLSSTLARVDWFTPSDYANMNTYDLDLGAGGPSLFPNPSTFGYNLVQGGKEGKVYTLSQSSLGGLASASTCLQTATPPCLQASIQCTSTSHAKGTVRQIVLWQNPNTTATMNMYIWGSGDGQAGVYNGGDELRLYQYTSGGSFTNSGLTWAPSGCSPSITDCSDGLSGGGCANGGGWMSLSANGTAGGVLWAIAPGIQAGTGRNLYAFNAQTLALLWSTSVGNIRRWVPPVIAKGVVYVASPDAASGTGSSWVTAYWFKCPSNVPNWDPVCGKCHANCLYGWDDVCCRCIPYCSPNYWCQSTCGCKQSGQCFAPPP